MSDNLTPCSLTLHLPAEQAAAFRNRAALYGVAAEQIGPSTFRLYGTDPLSWASAGMLAERERCVAEVRAWAALQQRLDFVDAAITAQDGEALAALTRPCRTWKSVQADLATTLRTEQVPACWIEAAEALVRPFGVEQVSTNDGNGERQFLVCRVDPERAEGCMAALEARGFQEVYCDPLDVEDGWTVIEFDWPEGTVEATELAWPDAAAVAVEVAGWGSLREAMEPCVPAGTERVEVANL